MKAIFNEYLLQRFNLLAFPLAIFWSLSTLGGIFLPSSTLESFEYQFEPFFEVFHFGHKFGITESADSTLHSKIVTTTTLVPESHRIKAIYRSNSDSFVTISDATTTRIVPLGGIYKNVFRLIALNDTAATFRGYGKTYRLRLGYDDPLSRQETLTQNISDPSQSGWEEGEWHKIPYKTVKEQISNLQNIEKNVDIFEVLDGDKIIGFQINSITPESVFAQLGIQNGDVILSINNKKLESYAAALAIYTQVPNLRSIRITLKRNNLQKEIIYEITR